ncbi:MAG: LysM peptidoglycan-binding domain-containing protein [Sodaliphilus sp.]
MILRYFLILCTLFGFASASAQSALNLPIKELNGESYYYYQVKKDAQIADISKVLGITAETIIKYNPSAKDGAQKNQLLFFPVSDFSASTAGTYKETTPRKVMHLVKKGQTLYGISKTYNVSIDDLVAANPSSMNGIKEGELIEIPIRNNTHASVVSPSGQSSATAIYHTIQKGESMYGVAKNYNTTIEKLLEVNPGIYPNHFVEGDVVKIYPNTSANITIKKDIKQMVSYTAKKDDSFESIAAAHHISVDQLKEVNPNLKKIKKGTIVYLPQDGTSTETVNSASATVKELEQTYAPKINELYSQFYKTNSDNEVNVAIILPFQLQNPNPPRQAYLYTDFYKGFLLAVDSIGKNVSKKININVYDTEHNLNKTDSILALPAMKKMDLIIAPSEPKQLERCNNFGLKNGIYVINCFSSKNEDYAHNPYIIQLNMPGNYLAGAVNQLISDKFSDYEVIFLKDAANPETEIIGDIDKYLSEHKIKSHTIDFSSNVDNQTISSYMDPGSNYLFIPTSSNKKFFAQCTGVLKSVKEQRYDCNVSFLGHPEYLAMRDVKETLKTLDSYVYSRFFVANEKRGNQIQEKFKKEYQENMIVTTPLLGVLGFDLATYIITTLTNQSATPANKSYFDGVQMDIELERSSNWGGYINKCVELVHFSPNGIKETIIK